MALLGADVPEGDRNRLRNRETGQWIGDSPALRRTLELYQTVYRRHGADPADLNYATDIGAAVREALANDQLGILASRLLGRCVPVGLQRREPAEPRRARRHGRLDAVAGFG